MNNKPLVYVMIPVYNGGATIAETLESLLNQSYDNYLIKIVDNASTDNTLEEVAKFKDERIEVINNSVTVGPYENLDRCIENCGGDFTAIYHADDVYEHDIIAKEVKKLVEHPEAGAVFTHSRIIDHKSRVRSKRDVPAEILRLNKSNIYSFAEIFRGFLKYDNFLMCPSGMVRTEIYKNEIKKWNVQEFSTSADMGAWLKILENHKIAIIPEALINYRVGRNSSYHINFLRTEPVNGFKVLDYYLKKDWVKRIISKEDLANYENLQKTDRVFRALNAFRLGKRELVLNLTAGILCLNTIKYFFIGRKGRKTLLGGLCLRILALLGLPIFFRRGLLKET